jgi:hypothetical protein
MRLLARAWIRQDPNFDATPHATTNKNEQRALGHGRISIQMSAANDDEDDDDDEDNCTGKSCHSSVSRFFF